jgi:hypothetical protein
MSDKIYYGEQALPAGRAKFRLDEVAWLLRVSNSHIWKLVKSRELIVPHENIDAAPSRPSIYIPRESLVDFLLARRSGRGSIQWPARRKEKEKRNGTQRTVPAAAAKTAQRKKDLRRRSKSQSATRRQNRNG